MPKELRSPEACSCKIEWLASRWFYRLSETFDVQNPKWFYLSLACSRQFAGSAIERKTMSNVLMLVVGVLLSVPSYADESNSKPNPPWNTALQASGNNQYYNGALKNAQYALDLKFRHTCQTCKENGGKACSYSNYRTDGYGSEKHYVVWAFLDFHCE
jgi:hypothetical protein